MAISSRARYIKRKLRLFSWIHILDHLLSNRRDLPRTSLPGRASFVPFRYRYDLAAGYTARVRSGYASFAWPGGVLNTNTSSAKRLAVTPMYSHGPQRIPKKRPPVKYPIVASDPLRPQARTRAVVWRLCERLPPPFQIKTAVLNTGSNRRNMNRIRRNRVTASAKRNAPEANSLTILNSSPK